MNLLRQHVLVSYENDNIVYALYSNDSAGLDIVQSVISVLDATTNIIYMVPKHVHN